MKIQNLILGLCCTLTLPLISQQNNTLRGKMLFLSSGKIPAIGVEVSGSIKTIETANTVYTTGDGSYILTFPKARDGNRVNLVIGSEDQDGHDIEVVNDREIDICQIPADASDEFEIIVCRKGSRDLAAQKYYKIIKTSSDIALAKFKKEMDELLAQQEKDYKLITEYGDKISKLEKQTDSLSIYREAFHIASINKDNASRRVLRYIQLLDEDKSILEAREALSIKDAATDLNQSMKMYKAAMEELETRAGASASIYDYDDAITCYDTIISYAERMIIDPLMIARYYSNSAGIILKDGKYEKALKYEEKALGIRQEILNSRHPSLAESYNKIGVIYRNLGEYDKALENIQKALEIRKEIFDPNHSSLALSYHSIGVTYNNMGKYDKAMEYYNKALEIRKEIFDPNHPSLAKSYRSIGLVYINIGEYDKALEYAKKNLEIRKEIFDPNHPSHAGSYNNIGHVYLNLGEYDKALEYQQKALEIKKEILDPNHPSLAISYSSVGLVYYNMGEYDKALEYNQKAFDIKKKVLDPNHPSLALSYNSIGVTYDRLGEYDKALEYAIKALDIRKKVLNPNLPRLAISYNSIGVTYNRLGEYDKALEYQQKALDIRKEIFDPNHPSLAYSYNNIGLTYAKLNQFKEAYEAFTAHEKKFPKVGRSFRNWAMYYAQKGDKEKALSNLIHALELGYNDLNWLETDDSMDSLRNEDEFKTLIKGLKEKKK